MFVVFSCLLVEWFQKTVLNITLSRNYLNKDVYVLQSMMQKDMQSFNRGDNHQLVVNPQTTATLCNPAICDDYIHGLGSMTLLAQIRDFSKDLSHSQVPMA